METFANTQSEMMKRRVARYMLSTECPACGGKRLKPEPLSVTFAGYAIAGLARLPLNPADEVLRSNGSGPKKLARDHPEKALVVARLAQDLRARIAILIGLGLGYLSLDRSTPTRSPGELQRLRLATQIRSNLFGVVYVLDEPSAGLHPADTEALLGALDQLKGAGNSLFVVEHEVDVIRHADWIVDVGPAAGQHGGRILYSGPLEGLASVAASQTRRYLAHPRKPLPTVRRESKGHLKIRGVTRNNLRGLDVDVPLRVLASVTGVSGSGKSSLISQFL